VDGAESVVIGIQDQADGQDLEVTASDPRHLEEPIL
jgi:hypothetical protein